MFGRRSFIFGSATTAVLGLASGVEASDQITVVTTTGMIADAARQVGGDVITVQVLMGPGVDPHTYRQTRSDIVALTRADLVLWHGLYLEAQMEVLMADLARKRPVVAVAEALPRDVLLGHDDYADKFDPHVWMVPTLWADVVAEVCRALTEVAPQHADHFAARAAAHTAELNRLAAYATAQLLAVPEPARVLVTAHDAFGYFGAAYGFEVIGIQGISTESEVGLSRVRSLVELLVDRGIDAVFVESSVSDRNIRALIEGAAAKGHEVAIGGELFSDAMGPEGSYESTYIGMIDHNVTVIAAALGVAVPPRGLNGLLGLGS
ncbi:MAG: zinc ABC transporter substrate-binding protein [Rhodobacteraceae bacterium]|nr:zinc ABC transporter substrate-binding protein [Paracoccaceae bacterium]